MMSEVLIVICFSLLIIISLAGNCLVCRTLIQQRRGICSNSTNLLIGVLAISDLMMTTFNIPFTVVDIILNDWIFGNFFCILVSFVQANSVYVSSFTMAVIAIDRCKAIYKFRPKANNGDNSTAITANTQNSNSIHNGRYSKRSNDQCYCCCLINKCIPKCPIVQTDDRKKNDEDESSNSSNHRKAIELKPKTKFKLQQRNKMILIILAIWSLAAFHSLPHTIFNRVTVLEVYRNDVNSFHNNFDFNQTKMRKISTRRCIPQMPEWFGEDFSLWLTLFTTATQYVIPLSCAAIIYTRIAFTINSQGKVAHMTETRAERINKHKRRRLLMLALIVVIFAVCWLPFNVYYLLLDFGILKSYNHTAFLCCLWLATSSVCYNPFVYCWLNKSFRKEATNVLNRIKSCLCCCRQQLP